MSLAEYSVGDGPNLTLVHGWGLGAEAWQPVVPLLADFFTVHVIDLPGYGASPGIAENTLESLADALAESLPPRAMLCGWSLGAMVCMACAARHPRKVARMVLASGTASFVQRDGWPEALPRGQLDQFVAQLGDDPAALIRHFTTLMHHGDVHARELVRAMRQREGLPADVATLRAGLALLGDADLRHLATEVLQPTLLVHGSEDPLMPGAAAQRLARLLYEGSVDMFEGSAHAPFASDPARFVDAVSGFAGVTS
jgi:pimeloyl-[acyl-carrier protein] methyl ester esterase